MKEYLDFEDRESDWLSKQKRLEKETLDLDEAKTLKHNHEEFHRTDENQKSQAQKMTDSITKIIISIIALQVIAIFTIIFKIMKG